MRKPRKDTIRGRSNGSHDEINGVDEERESEVLMKREKNPRKRGFLCVLKRRGAWRRGSRQNPILGV